MCTVLCLVTLSCLTVSPPGSSVHGDSPSENTGVGCHALLQDIFPMQGSNPGLPHCRWILYRLSHQGSPRILEWVTWPFSRGSSWPRNRTRVSCSAGRFFTGCATREALSSVKCIKLLCNQSSELFHTQKLPLFPSPQPLISTILLSVSVSLTTLDTSCK